MSDARKSIHRYFEEFGYEIGEAIYKELCKPGGINKLLRRLGLPQDGDPSKQYELLITYLRENGTKRLEEIAGMRPLDYHIGFAKRPEGHEDTKSSGIKPINNRVELAAKALERKKETQKIQAQVDLTAVDTQKLGEKSSPKVKPPTERRDPSERSTPDPDAPQEPAYRPSSIVTKESIAARKSPYDLVDRDGYPVGPLIPGTRPKAGTYSSDTPSWDPEKPHDPTGEWPAVERRSGRERRRMPDRRNKFDIVYRNMRYGGERRSDEERRKNWPKNGHKK